MKSEKKILRWIAYFFAGMIAFTFISRAAESMTIPKVRVETSKKGSLNFSVKGTGSVTSAEENVVFLPAGGRPVSFAGQGNNVEKGEVLAMFDIASLKEKAEAEEAELRKLELSMQQQAVSGEPADQVREQDAAMRTVSQKEEELRAIQQQLEERRQEYQVVRKEAPKEEQESSEAKAQELEAQIRELEMQEEAGQNALQEAQNLLADAQARDEKTQSNNERQRQASELARQEIQVDIEQKRKEVERFHELIQSEGKIYTPVSGNVIETTVTLGTETSGQEYIRIGTGNDRMTAELEKEEVSGLKEKDRLTVASLDGKKEAEGTVIEIQDIPGDESGQEHQGTRVRILAALEKNELQAGEAVEFQAGMKSKEYGTLIPVNALREDSSGRFVLVLEEKKSILGKEMIASRVAVTVLERDSSNAAVESALMKGDQMIVSSNKSIKAGDKVRLE